MFRQDRTNPSTAVSNWRGRLDTLKGWPSTAVSTWLNGGLFGGGIPYSSYWFGGQSGSAYGTTIGRVTFDTDTFSYLAATIGFASRNVGALSNNGVAGYAYGGGEETGTPSQTDEINKLDFATETCSVISTTMGVAQESTYTNADVGGGDGYLAGGYDLAGTTRLATVRVFVFASDTYTSNATSLSAASSGGGSYSNDGTAGYWAGAININSDKIDKTTYSDGTLATLSATLGNDVGNVKGTSNSGTAGYLYGGYHLIWDELSKLTYATDATSAIDITGLERYDAGGASNNGVAAYWYGGNNSAHGKVNTILKTPYATESTAAITATITQPPGGSASGATTAANGCANCETL